jgi:acetyl esterase
MGILHDPAAEITNPEVLEILKGVPPAGGFVSASVEEKRLASRAAIPRSGPPEPVESVTNENISAHGRSIPLRIYRPKLRTDRAATPLVLYFHGGGFAAGDLDTHDPVCRMLSNHASAIVVSVGYRLAPESPYPAAVEDCFASLEWAARSARNLGASQVLVAGDSAGGNLAAVVALMARDRADLPLAGQILIYPMVDATLASLSLIENAVVPPFTLADCVYVWQLYLQHDEDRRNPHISPLRAERLVGLAPALVITAEHDILADEGEEYVNRLREAGVPVQHEHYPDMVHGFFLWAASVAAARVAMNRVVQFIEQLK